jgi:ABC-type spermidine/putrescine transport system permease subunit II
MRRRARRPAWETLFYAITGAAVVFLVAPIMLVVPMSFSASRYLQFPPSGFSLQWYRTYFSRIEWQLATLVSLQVATTTMLIATALGTMAAFVLVRWQFPGKTLVHMFLFSPLLIAPIITSLGLYLFFAKLGLLGTATALVLAHLVLTLPYTVTVVSAALRGFDRRLEYASQSLGASPVQTFFKITLPIIRPGVGAAALFAFAISFDEVVIAMFISGTGARTLPTRMWESVQVELDPTMSAVSSLIIGCTLAVFLWSALRRHRPSSVD